MRSIEYRRWAPLKSSLSIEFPAELLLELGWTDISGALYGSRAGREVRVVALDALADQEEEKVGVFVSRIRGEVFLTENDLALMNREQVDLALVVAGRRAGFFIREADGSIQTVRSHEEFSLARSPAPQPRPKLGAPTEPPRNWIPMAVCACLPLTALMMFPQRPTRTSRSIQIREASRLPETLNGGHGRQLLISWNPAENAVLSIDDGGTHIALPVHADQSSVTYAARGGPVEVTLDGIRKLSAHYVVR